MTRLERFSAPFGREVILDDVVHDSGLKMLRLTVREGRRFTVLDIDADTAQHWGAALSGWASRSGEG